MVQMVVRVVLKGCVCEWEGGGGPGGGGGGGGLCLPCIIFILPLHF